VNLYVVFAASNPDSLYFVGPDNHWNDHGRELAARVATPPVARFLREKRRP